MVGESNRNVLLIQVDASSFVEFELSELEISRFDCNNVYDFQGSVYATVIGEVPIVQRICHVVPPSLVCWTTASVMNESFPVTRPSCLDVFLLTVPI